jgi:hypothetical protein
MSLFRPTQQWTRFATPQFCGKFGPNPRQQNYGSNRCGTMRRQSVTPSIFWLLVGRTPVCSLGDSKAHSDPLFGIPKARNAPEGDGTPKAAHGDIPKARKWRGFGPDFPQNWGLAKPVHSWVGRNSDSAKGLKLSQCCRHPLKCGANGGGTKCGPPNRCQCGPHHRKCGPPKCKGPRRCGPVRTMPGSANPLSKRTSPLEYRVR